MFFVLIEWRRLCIINRYIGDMGRVLITGGSGFIGTTCTLVALESGMEVSIIDNNEPDIVVQSHAKSKKVSFYKADIRNAEILEKAMEGCDSIIHLAAQISVPYSFENPKDNHSINVEGTSLVISLAEKHDINRLIVASSAAVYGDSGQLPLEEESAGELLSPYAESKWNNEKQIIAARERGVEAIALRFFNVYGPFQNANSSYAAVIPKFISMMNNGEQPSVFGDGSNTRDFIHVSDVAQLIISIIEGDWKATSHVYNVATQKETSLLELIELINSKIGGLNNEYKVLSPIFHPSRQGDIVRSCASIELVKKDFNWSPTVSIENGIGELIIHIVGD